MSNLAEEYKPTPQQRAQDLYRKHRHQNGKWHDHQGISLPDDLPSLLAKKLELEEALKPAEEERDKKRKASRDASTRAQEAQNEVSNIKSDLEAVHLYMRYQLPIEGATM